MNTLNDTDLIDEYGEIADEMQASEVIIFFEGEKNKLFYQSLKEFEGFSMKNGYSSPAIKEKITESENFIGILDHDYEHNKLEERLYKIDYYSLENVSIEYIAEMDILRSYLHSHLNAIGIEEVKYQKLKFNFKIDIEVMKTHFKGFTSTKVANQYFEYIDGVILCADTFLKYANLKDVVESYCKYMKNRYGKKKQIKYFENLSETLPSKSCIHIFTSEEYNRLILKLNE